jgi:SAM-dependent methyltransferase
MSENNQSTSSYTDRPIAERTNWYSPVALAYDKARPGYPAGLVAHVAHLAQISSFSRLLEIGCGPGTATLTFAGLECPIVCIEPNPDFCELAKQNCRSYQNVNIIQSSFEEWPIEKSAFDVVFSASAFHWIQSEVGYPKVADALRENGYFVLLWNKEPQPALEIWPMLADIYAQQGLSHLGQFESESTQHHLLNTLAQPALDSGLFKAVTSKLINVELSYSAEDYILLLSSFSPYLCLDESHRTSLFTALYRKINDDLMGTLDLSYISAAYIFQKISR